MGSWRNTSHDIPTAFCPCKIPCCRVHLIINTWLQRWAKEVTVAKWYDSVSVRSVLRPLKLEYIPTKSKVHSLPKKGCWTSNFSLQIISAFVAGSFITLIAAFVVLRLIYGFISSLHHLQVLHLSVHWLLWIRHLRVCKKRCSVAGM